jgi:hypothetical protein
VEFQLIEGPKGLSAIFVKVIGSGEYWLFSSRT